MKKFQGVFMAEAGEHLDSLARSLMQLGQPQPSPEEARAPIDAIFRHVHTLKGMVAAMDLPLSASVAHRIEDLVAVVRDRPASLTSQRLDLLLGAADHLRMLIHAEVTKGLLPDSAPLLAQIASLIRSLAEKGTPSAPTPEAQRPVEPRGAPSSGASTWVCLRLAEGCAMPGPRAFLAYRKLSAAGPILEVVPPLDALKSGALRERCFSVRVAAPCARVRAVVEGLSEVTCLDLGDAGAPPPESPTAVPNTDRLTPWTEEPPASGMPPAVEGIARSIRVNAAMLDQFLVQVNLALDDLERLRTSFLKELSAAPRGDFDAETAALHQRLLGLQKVARNARVLPLSVIVAWQMRAVQKLAEQRGLAVRVMATGAEIEVRRRVLDAVADPLLQLLRNAVVHGIEAPGERQALGKPALGRIALEARCQGKKLILLVEDDGKGMDAAKLTQAAKAQGLLPETALDAMDAREALNLCFLPGLSTARALTEDSGRGVGMDVVKSVVDGLGGRISIESTPGQGTRFRIELPNALP